MNQSWSGGCRNVAERWESMVDDIDRATLDSIIIALLEDIATGKHIGTNLGMPDRSAAYGSADLCWNVCADEPDESDEAAVTAAARRLPPAAPHTAVAPSERRGTIVLAEDDEGTRVLLERVLTRAGFTVFACANGQLACDAVARRGADVVLLDWMMPVMDGPTAVLQLKSNARTRGIPVVMLTMQSDVEERVEAFNTGVQDFLSKPFDPRELVARIEQQLRWRRMLAADAKNSFSGESLELYGPMKSM